VKRVASVLKFLNSKTLFACSLFHSLRTGSAIRSLVSPGVRSAPSRMLAEVARSLLRPTATWARWSSSPYYTDVDVGLFCKNCGSSGEKTGTISTPSSCRPLWH